LEETSLWKIINNNPRLQTLEKEGFKRGEKEGKTMNVSIETIFESLEKQWKDVVEAWDTHKDWKNAPDLLKTKLADLRNVCGCMFLKIEDEEKK